MINRFHTGAKLSAMTDFSGSDSVFQKGSE